MDKKVAGGGRGEREVIQTWGREGLSGRRLKKRREGHMECERRRRGEKVKIKG